MKRTDEQLQELLLRELSESRESCGASSSLKPGLPRSAWKPGSDADLTPGRAADDDEKPARHGADRADSRRVHPRRRGRLSASRTRAGYRVCPCGNPRIYHPDNRGAAGNWQAGALPAGGDLHFGTDKTAPESRTTTPCEASWEGALSRWKRSAASCGPRAATGWERRGTIRRRSLAGGFRQAAEGGDVKRCFLEAVHTKGRRVVRELLRPASARILSLRGQNWSTRALSPAAPTTAASTA